MTDIETSQTIIAAPVQVVGAGATPPAVRTSDPAMEAALFDSIERLEEVVDEETAALAARGSIDLGEFNRRKSRSLLELTRISRAVSGRVLGADLGLRLSQVGDKLERNQELLRMHLAAAQEVAGLISDALREAESDGTYSSDARRPGRGR